MLELFQLILQFHVIQQNPCYKFMKSAMNIVCAWMLICQCLQLTHDNGLKWYTLGNTTVNLRDPKIMDSPNITEWQIYNIYKN